MAEDCCPRYTSTPIAPRKTSTLLNNLIKVSPIYPSPEKTRNIKSFIPVLSTNEINLRPKSNEIQSNGAKTKVSLPTNYTGEGSSGLTKIPSQIPKPGADKKNTNNNAQASMKNATEVLLPVREVEPQKSHQNTIDQDDSQPKTHKVSKRSQKLSTLPSVPEGASIDAVKLAEDCIFKTSETQSGWLIPKETKTRVSLKRKSSVPCTVTKRNKTIKTPSDLDDESLFDSPELPNLVEVSSLRNNRKTYVLKKKPELSDIQEHHKSVTDGIIPLENLSQKGPLDNIKVKSTLVNSKEKTKQTIVRKNNEIREQTVPENKLDKENEGKEDIEQSASPNIKVNKNKRKCTKQTEPEKENDIIESANSKAESLVKTIVSYTIQEEPKNGLGKEISVLEKSSKEPEVDIIAHQKKETKNKNPKPNKKRTNLNQDLNSESMKSDTRQRRTLRERKPNLQYLDSPVIINGYNAKEIDGKKKKVSSVKSSQELKENPYEPVVESKSEKKKKVKGNKKSSIINSVPIELPLQHHGKGQEDDFENLNTGESFQPEIYPEKQEKVTAPKKINNVDKQGDKNNKKEIENKKKVRKVGETHPDKEKEEQTNNVNLNQESDNTSKIDLVVSTATNTKKKTQSKKQNSLGKFASQTNEVNAECQNAGVLIDNDRFEMVLHEAGSIKSTGNNKTRSVASPKTKHVCKTADKNSSIKLADSGNLSVKPAKEDAGNSSQSTKEKINSQGVEKDQIKRKTNLRKCSSKSQPRMKSKNSVDVSEHSMVDKPTKFPDNCTETESNIYSLGKKHKSEDLENSYCHSGTESASKKRKCDDCNSGKVKNAERGFSIQDLFGMHELITQEVQPGVVAAKSIHIHNFVMMGEVCLEPGATLSKISTNTTYSVQEGIAQVTIKKHTKYYKAGDQQHRFFIPKNIEVSITNTGNLPLKMEFVKFRG